jgi:hypothetical protein
MTVEEKLQEAEADLTALSVRARNVLPTLKRVAEDSKDWRKDITNELLLNLSKIIDQVHTNQARRSHQ